jgi:hypothetical protein
VNLTNGLEALDALSSLVPPDELRFTRLQSSHCESGAYDKLLAELDHDLLWSLASGHTCVATAAQNHLAVCVTRTRRETRRELGCGD